MPKISFKKHVFSNGLRYIEIPDPRANTVTVLVLVQAGSKYETKDINGLSHFLEHMCFKGTKTKPTNLDVAYPLESIGAHYNAFTSQEYTGYFAKVDSRHAHIAFDAIPDIYLNSIYDEKEIEKERGVIIAEKSMNFDNPRKYIWDLMFELLYGDQPAGWQVIGSQETIKGINREDFINYLNNRYRSRTTVVAVSGTFDKEKSKKLIEKSFSKMRLGLAPDKLPVIEKQSEPQILIEKRNTEQTHFIISFRAYNLFDERRYPASLLAAIIGQGMTSRLWQNFRSKLGIAYYVYADYEPRTDHGVWGVAAGVHNNKIEIGIISALKVLKELVHNPPGAKELKKAKEYIKGSSILELEGSEAKAFNYGLQEVLTGKIESLEQEFRKIDAVTASDIQRTAKDLLKSNKINLALIGPHKDKERLLKLLRV